LGPAASKLPDTWALRTPKVPIMVAGITMLDTTKRAIKADIPIFFRKLS
jgi:hypothetical protein